MTPDTDHHGTAPSLLRAMMTAHFATPSAVSTPPQGSDGARAWFDAILRLPESVWQHRWHGPLPELGSRLLLHPDLPLATVVSVIEGAGQTSGAALLRFADQAAAATGVGYQRVLTSSGWSSTPATSEPFRPAAAVAFPLLSPRG